MGWALSELSRAYYGLGDLSKAVEAAKNSVDMAEAIGDQRLAVFCGNALVMIQQDMGNDEAALSTATLFQQRGEQLRQTLMLTCGNHALAYCHALHGDWETAGELMDAVDIAVQKTDSRIIPLYFFGFYGLVALGQGDVEKAERIIANNLSVTREAGSNHCEAEGLRVLAQIRSAQGRREQAQELFKQAIQIFERLESRLELGKTWYTLGKAQIDRGEAKPGHESVENALQIFRACHANYWVTKALELTA